MSSKFLRRSLLYVPGSSEKMIEKSIGVSSDAIIFDLEDAVSPAEKESARANVVNNISRIKDSGKEAIVRVNSMESRWGILDIIEITKALPDTILIPKADEKALVIADGIISAQEEAMELPKGTFALIGLFETAYSIANPLSIIRTTPRLNGVQLGAEDLTKELEISRTLEGGEITYARHQLATAAKSAGIDIIDTPYTGIKDLEGLERDSFVSKNIGFTGKTCIHPAHIETINKVFSPTQAEVEFSSGLMEAYEAAIAEGKGACMYQNKMIDAPIADRARRILLKAERIAAQAQK